MARQDDHHRQHGPNDAWSDNNDPAPDGSQTPSYTTFLYTGPEYNTPLTETAGSSISLSSLADGVALGPTTEGLNMVYFITGITNSGSFDYTDHNYWNWKGNNPATYGGLSTGYAHEWTPGSTVTYSFDSGSNWTAAEQAAFTDALNMVSAVANISFSEVSTGGDIDIVRSTTSNSAFTSTNYGYSSTVGMGLISSGTTTIDTNVTGWNKLWSFSASGGYGPETVLHEMLTEVGLGRPGPYNATVSKTQPLYGTDTQQYSVMSYVPVGSAIATYVANEDGDTPSPANYTVGGTSYVLTTPGQYDILAVQRLYGAATSGPLTTGETFGFNASSILKSDMPAFDFTVNTNPVVTIYDSGTGNTLDLSGFTTASTVDLNPGQFSSADGMVDNIGIAFNTWIDTAIGGSGNDTFYVNSQADTINGGGGTNTVVFGGDQSSYSLSHNAGTVTVSDLGITDILTNIQTLQFADASLATSSIPCFTRGTRILTPDGEIAVEELREGDLVCVEAGGARPVKWIGHRTIDLAVHPHPPAAAPIRIVKGAFGDDLPWRDLLLSPDHAIKVNGSLIPAVLLVNGCTIVQELLGRSVTYLHLELDRHGVVLAEGLPVESYLDTGNRAMFANAGVALILHPDCSVRMGVKTWEHDACAPLLTEGLELATVRQRLLERAANLGSRTSPNARLRLLAAGQEILPNTVHQGRYVFVLPAGCQRVHIRSRSAVPAEVGAHPADWRRLGVAISRINFVQGHDRQELPMDHPSLLRGWYAAESGGEGLWRWTDGAGLLPLPVIGAPKELEIHVSGLLPGYWTISLPAKRGEAALKQKNRQHRP
jgi:serralysin